MASLFPPSFVARLAATPSDALRCGARGAELCRLATLGVRVPAGLVVTTGAFAETIDALGLRAAHDTLADAMAQGELPSAYAERIARVLRTGSVPRGVLDAIEDALIELELDVGVPLTLEGSLALAEERGAPSVGELEIQHTVDLEPAIRRLYARVFEPDVLAFAAQRALASPVPLAIVVRRSLGPVEVAASGGPFDAALGELGDFARRIEDDLGSCQLRWARSEEGVCVVGLELGLNAAEGRC